MLETSYLVGVNDTWVEYSRQMQKTSIILAVILDFEAILDSGKNSKGTQPYMLET